MVAALLNALFLRQSKIRSLAVDALKIKLLYGSSKFVANCYTQHVDFARVNVAVSFSHSDAIEYFNFI